MNKILVVEDSPIVTKIIRHMVKQQPALEAVYACNMAQAQEMLMELGGSLFAALADLNLPDAPDGEVVDLLLKHRIPTIVLTGSFDEQRREAILAKGVVDYVVKEGRYSYEYAVSLINRIANNQSMAVLVVDDSDTARGHIVNLLRQQLFEVVEASNGVEAIKVLLSRDDIRLLITDYNMPQMDGVELIKNLRYKYEKSDLIIIGLSGEGASSLSAKFIKNGANDFLKKPFNHEEFNCRVRHNVEALEWVQQIQDLAYSDYLTGCWNRHYFFEHAEPLYQAAKEQQRPLAVAVIDLDRFKQVNDTYGHNIGDRALVTVANKLTEALGRFLVARTGGEEFAVLMPGLDNDQAQSLISQVRQIVGNIPIEVGGDETLYVSFSAGVTNQLCDSLDAQLAHADKYLYRAKQAGRDIVIGDEDDHDL